MSSTPCSEPVAQESESVAELRAWLNGERSTNNWIRTVVPDPDEAERLIIESDNARIAALAALVNRETALMLGCTTA